jgi:hypothetical protein
MEKALTISEKRNQLKEQLESRRSLPENILDGMGAAYQRLVNPAAVKARGTFLPISATHLDDDGFPSFWLSGIAIGLITFLIGWVVAITSGNPLTPEELKLSLWAAVTGPLALIANKINIRAFLNTFRVSCVDKILRVSDMDNLEKWLVDNFIWWKPLLAGLVIGPLLGWFLYVTWLGTHPGINFHIGPFLIVVLSCIQSVLVGYYLYPFYVAFPSRLNRYRFDLYEPDPSSSEVVGQLSRLLTFLLYVTMAYIVWLTVGLGYVEVLTADTPQPGIVFSIFVWAPTVILYSTGQYHLSELIIRAKWKTINEIQKQVEELYKEEKIPDKETLERLGKLMDYHDRIKATPNSALNFRASLNFLNSLLLPILAFVAANLKDVINLIRGM